MSGHTKTRRRLLHWKKDGATYWITSAFRQKNLSLRPPLLRGEGESNEALRKHEKGRQECLPHLHTRFRDGSTSHCAPAELIDWRIKQLTVAFHELIRLGG